MIPTLILAGLVVGFLPRPWYLVGIALAAATWPLLRVASGSATIDTPGMLGEFALACANVAVGVVIARLLFNLVRATRD
jgi:hypothetical protein